MRRSRFIVYSALALLVVTFAYGMIRLLASAYGLGDIYPEYSSFRTDPMGAKVFYESLDAAPALSVNRNLVPVEKLTSSIGPSALFFLAGNPWEFVELTQDELEGLQTVVNQGGRIVVTFSPEMLGPYLKGKYSLDKAQERAKKREEDRKAGREVTDDDFDDSNAEAPAEKTDEKKLPAESPGPATAPSEKQDAQKNEAREPEKDAGREKTGRERLQPKRVFLPGKWGFRFATEPLPKKDDDTVPGTALRVSGDHLPDSVVWRSPLVFKDLDDAWRVIYRRDQSPVIVERRFGAGSIVLCADSYFVSNEAMRYNRYTELLAWLVGPQSRVLFDETHNGVVDEPGIVKLARKYRLHGIALALFALTVLYIWKNAFSLVPPIPERDTTESVNAALGKDAASAFVNLLRRSVPARNLLGVCVHEWEKSIARARPDLGRRVEWMKRLAAEQSALLPQERDLVGTYRTISHELRKEWKR